MSESLLTSSSGKRFTLTPKDYIIGEAVGNDGICLAWPVATPPSPDGIDWALGAPFLRTVYAVLSYGIEGKEPPLIGLYSIANNTVAADKPLVNMKNISSTSSSSTSTTSSVSSTSTSVSPTPVRADATTSEGALPLIPTTLPNTLLPTPTFTPPPYLFDTTKPKPSPTTSGFGTSTYAPALRPLNATGVPVVVLPVSTIVTTDPAGNAVTTTVPEPSGPPVVLGLPHNVAPRGARASVPLLALALALCALR